MTPPLVILSVLLCMHTTVHGVPMQAYSDTVLEIPEYTADPVLGALTLPLDQYPSVKGAHYVSVKNCYDILEAAPPWAKPLSGLYTVQPGIDKGDRDAFVVYCDMDLLGGGWTIIQRRVDQGLDFNKPWASYRNGFGDLTQNFWLGLENIRRLTDAVPMELYIGLERFPGPNVPYETAYASYQMFKIGAESDNYPLNIGNVLQSTAGDSLESHNGQPFSTNDDDRDNDLSELHCAQYYRSGWWFKGCHDSNLNGFYYPGGMLADPGIPDGIIWSSWVTEHVSLKTVVMAIKPAA